MSSAPKRLPKGPHPSAPSNVPSRVHTPKDVPVVAEAAPFGKGDGSDNASAITAALISEAELRAKYESMAAAAKEEEDKLAMLQGGRTLELRLAEALLRPKKGEGIGSGVGKQAVVRAVDLLRSWDANADGSISRQ